MYSVHDCPHYSCTTYTLLFDTKKCSIIYISREISLKIFADKKCTTLGQK